MRDIKKNKLISVFCSNKVFTEGHRARFNFCKTLKSHFKDKLDWFGNGVRPIENKWDGVAPYKYHISLENFRGDDYWTEKLMDPLMVLTHPIYCGATNIDQYFTKNHITEIDIKYPKTAIYKIEKLIEEDFYESNFSHLLEARDLVMDKYNLFNIITDIVQKDEKISEAQNTKLITIKNESFFLLQNPSLPTKSSKSLAKRLKKSLNKKLFKFTNFLTDYLLLIKFKFFNR